MGYILQEAHSDRLSPDNRRTISGPRYARALMDAYAPVYPTGIDKFHCHDDPRRR